MQNFLFELQQKNQNLEKNAFYVISTPIGNLADITIRALAILTEVDFVVCEDSRIAQKLLTSFKITEKKFIVYNDHSDQKTREKILNLLLNNHNLALISDAGTPMISDPGLKLIDYLRKNSRKIIPIPGVSSLTCAISVAGLACDQFIFLGFLPNSIIQKQKIFLQNNRNCSWIFFESANRLLETLEILDQNLSQNGIHPRICIARELTKIYEEIIVNQLPEVINYFQLYPEKIKGELVVIVEKESKNQRNFSIENIEQSIKLLINEHKSLKEISTELAEIYGIHKKEIYQLALKIKNQL
jgi:16S rRNA (cytidine1402-2'-O)-methyltransferase